MLRRPRLRMRSARMRLTMLYTGLFLLLGTALIMITVLLTGQSRLVVHAVSRATATAQPVAAGLPSPASQVRNGVIAQRSADLGRLLTVSWGMLAISALGSAALGWFAAGRVLRPLRGITATARTISAGNLHERLCLSGPDDEFKALGDTLDDLLGRLEASFEAQRRFVANASHELRTPLTLERTLLQVALADPNASTQALRSTAEELLELQAEHERLLEALLTLASSERGLERREPVDLPAVVEDALRRVRPTIDLKGLTLEISLEGPATTMGDRALVERLIANLIGNAVDYNVADGRLEIRTEADNGRAVLSVSNTGPRIPPEEVGRLFEPFQRLGGIRSGEGGHHGLGLSIVRAIATAHGAVLSADARPEGGLMVRVGFPGDRVNAATGTGPDVR